MTRLQAALAMLAQLYGAWRCRRGRHQPLVWRRARERAVPITNQPTEMMYASGLMALAKWIGWCPRCDTAVEWADHDPRAPLHTKPPTPAENDWRVQHLLGRTRSGARHHGRR